MRTHLTVWLNTLAVSIFVTACGGGQDSPAPTGPAAPISESESKQVLLPTPNRSGIAATITNAGFIDRSNPFFKPLGNGRSCASCHQPTDGWTITPAGVQARFTQSAGMDALFLALDGANSPSADLSTIDARRIAYSMLLTKGLIRIGLPIPAAAEFDLVHADDPYGYASSKELSLYRRPLPTANLKFAASVMWDGRETHKDLKSTLCLAGTSDCFSPLDFNLGKQASQAATVHAQLATALTADEQAAIVNFTKELFTAQVFDAGAKSLTGSGAQGGPLALSANQFYFGINDLRTGDYRTKAAFNPRAMGLYDAWNNRAESLADPDTAPSDAADVTAARRAIARGQALFNSKPIFINNVGGMATASIRGTCSSCHSAPNAGGHGTPLMLNIGSADAARRTPDMPLYTLKNKLTGETIQTTDPGAALLTAKWEDIGRFKVPVLRALASRAPYFHDGSANDLGEVLKFYDDRFKIGFTARDIADLTAFLEAL